MAPLTPASMRPLASQVLAEVGYDDASRTLFLRFRDGALYAYFDVPPATLEALEAAESKGRFFQAEIDPAFRYLRLA